MPKSDDRQRFNIALHEELAQFVRDDAKRMHRTIQGEIVALLERARDIVARNDPKDAA